MQAAVTGLQLADWAQTRWAIKHPEYRGGLSESNPFLPTHPSAGEANNLILAGVLVTWAIANALPSDYRKAWQAGWIVIEYDAVKGNKTVGWKFEF